MDELAQRVAHLTLVLVASVHAVQRTHETLANELIAQLDAVGGQHAAEQALDELQGERAAATAAIRDVWCAVDALGMLDLDLATEPR